MPCSIACLGSRFTASDYAELGLTEQQRRDLYKDGKGCKKKKGKDGEYRMEVPPPAKFKGIPGAFVFPSLFMLAVNFFLNGFVELGTYLVSFPIYKEDLCGSRCLAWGWAMLISCSLYACVIFAMLLHFYMIGHNAVTWEQAEEPETAEEVSDPLYRFVSKIRVRLFHKDHAFNIMDRARGEFVRPDEDIKEPARTERLLRRPLSLFRPRASDSLDSLKIAWFARANGGHFIGLSYDWVALVAGMLIAGLNGVGRNLEAGTGLANAEVLSVVSIQYATCIYVYVTKPSSDRIDNVLSSLQFFVEGSQTGVLFLGGLLTTQGDTDGAKACQDWGFYFGLAAMFLPIFEKVYDAMVVPISGLCRGEFDPRATAYAMLSLALALPSVVLSMVGISASGVDDLTGTIDEAMGVVDIIADEGLLLAEGLSDIASDLFWMSKSKKHHRAANRIQANLRGVQSRDKVKKLNRAAKKVVSRSRQTLVTQRKGKARHMAIVFIQNAFRSKRVRDNLEVEGDEEMKKFIRKMRAKIATRRTAKSVDRASREERRAALFRRKTVESRPGFEWLEKATWTLGAQDAEEFPEELDSHKRARMRKEPSQNSMELDLRKRTVSALPGHYPPLNPRRAPPFESIKWSSKRGVVARVSPSDKQPVNQATAGTLALASTPNISVDSTVTVDSTVSIDIASERLVDVGEDAREDPQPVTRSRSPSMRELDVHIPLTDSEADYVHNQPTGSPPQSPKSNPHGEWT